MISPNKRITDIIWVQRSDAADLIGGIRNNKGHQINTGYSTPLINNLEIKFFKDKNKEKGVGIIDFINRIV
jgi:hypothetical protein